MEDGRGERTVTTSATEMEGLLLDFQERILMVEKKCLRKKGYLWEHEQACLGKNTEFLRMKEEFLRQTEDLCTKEEAFYRERDRRLEESRLRLQRPVLKSEIQLGLNERGEQLLPGILDEITLNQITPKLSWKELHIMSSASRGWLEAIRNHRVYDGKVHSKSTETFVVVLDYAGTLALCSLKDNSHFQLPPISHLGGGIPLSSTCIALAGKIYVLGGAFGTLSDKVYVLDLAAGQSSWTLCESMHEPRSDFGCGVLDGKIYVFGGRGFRRDLCESEVYDPKKNTWRPIAPMSSPRRCYQVAQLRAELVIHSRIGDSGVNRVEGEDPGKNILEVYSPLTDDWTKKRTFDAECLPIFGAHNKLHWMRSDAVLVHDFEENSWIPLNSSHSIVALDRPRDGTEFRPSSVSVIGDDLLAIGYIYCVDVFDERSLELERQCVLRSMRYNSEEKVIKWREEVRDCLTIGQICSTFPIQL